MKRLGRLMLIHLLKFVCDPYYSYCNLFRAPAITRSLILGSYMVPAGIPIYRGAAMQANAQVDARINDEIHAPCN